MASKATIEIENEIVSASSSRDDGKSESPKPDTSKPKPGPSQCPVSEAVMKKISMRYVLDYAKAKLFRKSYNKSDDESIQDEVIVVTGAAKGLGKAIAWEMAKRGGTIVLACRNMSSGQTTLDEIKTAAKNENLVLMKLDVSDFDSIRSFVQEFKTKFPKLKLLVNNAGVMNENDPSEKTATGHNKHMATNFYGPFLLTNLLLESLKSGAPSRVVTVTSGILQAGKLDLEDIDMTHVEDFGFRNILPYTNSKLAVAYFSKELGERIKDSGTRTYSLCPGLVMTDMTMKGDSWISNLAIKFLAYSTHTACDTVLICSLGKSTANQTGQIYQNRIVSNTLASALLDEKLSSDLWKLTADIVGLTEK